MSFQSWWQQKSRRAKAIAIIATTLILQIGLCFGTPATVSWSDQTLGTHLNHNYDALGYMMVEALLAGVVFLVLIAFLIFYRPSDGAAATSGTTPAGESANDTDSDRF
ncbi:hypothetical protein [Occallatibacter savannae]|uniref:hypothetical protein n=1 Tax=Occallatibacter savannae TaxID=1002691 RepID=UPI000D686233|nr:hypothetical protein [Occallatibacter savannae]